MLTLKDWNSLDSGRRKRIVSIFFSNMSEEFREDISQPFHHNFDWEGKPGTYQEGRWYKLMLSHCYKQKGDRIKVILIV